MTRVLNLDPRGNGAMALLALALSLLLNAQGLTPRPQNPVKVAANAQEDEKQIEAGIAALREGSSTVPRGSWLFRFPYGVATQRWRNGVPSPSVKTLEAETLIALAYAGEHFRRYTADDLKAVSRGGSPPVISLSSSQFRCEKDFTSDSEAAAWLLRLAGRGSYPAQEFVSVWYAKGRGFQRDYVMAYAWLDIAGISDQRDCLSRVMSPDEISRAQAFSAAYRDRSSIGSGIYSRVEWPSIRDDHATICEIEKTGALARTSVQPGDPVDAEIDRIRVGSHAELPAAQPVRNPWNEGRDPVYRAVNWTQYALRILFSGPVKRTVQIAPNASETISLPPGQYRVAAVVSGTSVLPFYGVERYDMGSQYLTTFYIFTRWGPCSSRRTNDSRTNASPLWNGWLMAGESEGGPGRRCYFSAER